MKSVPQIAEALDLSSTTIREYISRFSEFFADPVEYEGVKEYPDDTQDLVSRIHRYFTETEMTKEEIRDRLRGEEDGDETPAAVASPVAAAVLPPDSGQLADLGEKLDRLTRAIEALTCVLADSGQVAVTTAGRARQSSEKLNRITTQITDIIELGKGGDPDNIEQNVRDADGTIIFSFGGLSPNAATSMKFAKAQKKPWLHIDLEQEKSPGPMLRKWLDRFDIKVLNVAGRRASKVPGVKKSVNDILSLILKS